MGGTNVNCAVLDHDGTVLHRTSFSTEEPEPTLGRVILFFEEVERSLGLITAIGVGSFGPLDLNQESPKYGYITSTPKRKWSWTNVLGTLQDRFGRPVVITTDVNAAAIGEGAFGAAKSHKSFVYVTVGTGIGAGLIANGRPVMGANHPEVGHSMVDINFDSSKKPGGCPFHGSRCVEGVSSGPSLQKRWGQKPDQMPRDHRCWKEQAYNLAVLCHNICAFVAPEKIVLSGGVMRQEHLFPLIHKSFEEISNGYFKYLKDIDLSEFIVPSTLMGDAGVLGAFCYAKNGNYDLGESAL